MKWIEAIELSLNDLNGKATEEEIFDNIKKKKYRTFENSATPRRSLNMYLNRQFNKLGNHWLIINYSVLLADTIKDIIKLEADMKDKLPAVQERISKIIERGKIANKVKQLTGYKCLVCVALNQNPYSFIKPNNEFYIETHHVDFVSNLQPGALSLSNLITVCPNHHRQLHYGKSKLLNQTISYFTFSIDGIRIKIEKIKI